MKDDILSELAAYPAKHGIRMADVPYPVGVSLTAAAREELLALSNGAAVALAVGGSPPTPPAATPVPLPSLPAFAEGDAVTLTRDGETFVGREVLSGARGEVTKVTPDVVLVRFPQGTAQFTPDEARADLRVVEVEDEEDDDYESDW